jgi:predicted nucleotidyltransferase
MIEGIIRKIATLFSPLSIFLYGSRAGDDFLPTSDYEIGILFSADKMIDEVTLQNAIKADKQYRIYPYEVVSFIAGEFDLPFETAIFLKKMSLGAKTIYGEYIVENMINPPITVSSVMRDIKFHIGRASDAIVCSNKGYNDLAAHLFLKSCLLGTTDLIILEKRICPISYKNVWLTSNGLDLKEYGGITDRAYLARTAGTFEKDDLLNNVWFLNRLVERRIVDFYRKEGDIILIK